MKHHFTDLKHEIDLPNGVTLAKSVTGEIVAIALVQGPTGEKVIKRRTLDNDDAVLWLFYAVTDTFPEPPRIPHDPQAAERAAAAQASIAATKPHDFRVTVDPDGSVIMTLDTGERVRLESA